MRLPQMVLFDYGQTLVNQQKYDSVRGTAEVLKYAVRNKYNLTAEQVQREVESINRDLGRLDPAMRHLFLVEVPDSMFNAYIYEAQGIEIPLPPEEIGRIFWDAAAPGVPTQGMADFLGFLKRKGIRTGVVSNIGHSGQVVADRINRLLPENEFEFIITSSNYVFRKPHRRIFQLALEKADLPAEKVWYIGDEYECDIKGAQGAGITPIWYIGAIDLPYEEQAGICTVREWTELEDKMKGMEEGLR